jgi:16S rRNA (uracil1498-N3)-methyltransferase
LSRGPRAGELRLMFAERGGTGLNSLKADESSPPRAVVALVGPEGGWEEEEIGEAAANGWRVVTLGGRVLRAETAAVAVAALTQHLYGDLR